METQTLHSMLDRPVAELLGDEQILGLSVTAKAEDAARLMAEHQKGAVLVYRDDDMVGIFTERDLLERVIALGLNAGETELAHVMTPNPVTITDDHTVLSAIYAMREQSSRHLPVTVDGKVVGILSVRDLLRSVVQSCMAAQHQLERIWEGFPV